MYPLPHHLRHGIAFPCSCRAESQPFAEQSTCCIIEQRRAATERSATIRNSPKRIDNKFYDNDTTFLITQGFCRVVGIGNRAFEKDSPGSAIRECWD